MVNSKFCAVPLVVGVLPMSKDGNYTLEYGRHVNIQCISSKYADIIITKTNKTGSFTSKLKCIFLSWTPS